MVMHCPRCGAENPDHSQYCSLCLDVVGFEDPEMTTVEPAVDGYRTSYPSSFKSNEAPPQDPEWYSPGDAFAAQGHPQANMPPPPEPYAGFAGGAPYAAAGPYPAAPQDPAGQKPIDWDRAVFQCMKFAAVAAVMSIALELILSFVGLNAMVQGRFTLARIWLLLSLLIPVCFAGYASGFRIQRYGWAVGLISIIFWAFLFRPLYYALLGWLLEGRFQFVAIVSGESIAFTFGLFLPLGALLGWLGEKRATTGLHV